MSDVSAASAVRLASLRAVFAAMRTHGSVSRAELARLTGLSKQTMSDVARALEDAGWIVDSGLTSGAPGRRATTYKLQERHALALGIDLGGTKVNLALADLLGGVVDEMTEPTDPRGGRHVIRQIGRGLRAVAARAGLAPSRVRVGAMGCPGVVEQGTGRILLAPNIPGLDAFDVGAALGEELGFPVSVENDVNLAALGERAHPSRKTFDNLVFIALGTGIGMGIVANGRLVRGARGAAGEIAYLPLGADPFDSRGFRLGTLETAVGSAAIVDRYRAFGGDHTLDVQGIFDRLTAGEVAASRTLDDVARLLVQAVMAVSAVLDPDLLVFGGSIGARPELVSAIQRIAASLPGARPPIEASALGSRAVLAGAVRHAVEQLDRGLFASPVIEPAAAQP